MINVALFLWCVYAQGRQHSSLWSQCDQAPQEVPGNPPGSKGASMDRTYSWSRMIRWKIVLICVWKTHTHLHRHPFRDFWQTDDSGQRANGQISLKNIGSDRCVPSVYRLWLRVLRVPVNRWKKRSSRAQAEEKKQTRHKIMVSLTFKRTPWVCKLKGAIQNLFRSLI